MKPFEGTLTELLTLLNSLGATEAEWNPDGTLKSVRLAGNGAKTVAEAFTGRVRQPKQTEPPFDDIALALNGPPAALLDEVE